MDTSNVRLKWNNHSNFFINSLKEYCSKKSKFSDATIVCEDSHFLVHRIVLSTCSQYLDEIFTHSTSDNYRPLLILNETRVQDVEWLLSFMYCGEVTVPKEKLQGFFKLGEMLKVKGLSRMDIPTMAPTKGSASSTKPCSTVPMTQVFTSSSIAVPSATASTVTIKKVKNDGGHSGSKSKKRKVSGEISSKKGDVSPIQTFPAQTHPRICGTAKAISQNPSSIDVANPVKSVSKKPLSRDVETSQSSSTAKTASIDSPVVYNISLLPSGRRPRSCPSIYRLKPDAPTEFSNSRELVPDISIPETTSSEIHDGNRSSVSGGKTKNVCPDSIWNNPILTEIKEEIKDEPLDLGPDDPLIVEDDEYADEFNIWNDSDDNTTFSLIPSTNQRTSSPVPSQQPISSLKEQTTFHPVAGRQESVATPVAGVHQKPSNINTTPYIHVLPKMVLMPNNASNVVIKTKMTQDKISEKAPCETGSISGPVPTVSKSVNITGRMSEPISLSPKKTGLTILDKNLPKIQVKSRNELLLQSVIEEQQKRRTETSLDSSGCLQVLSKNSSRKTKALPKMSTTDVTSIDADKNKTMNVQKTVVQPGPSPVSVTALPEVPHFLEIQAQSEGDQDMAEMIELIQQDVQNRNPSFIPIHSTRKKNPPYLISFSKILSKDNEPVKFSLRGATDHQMISINMQYTDEKFKDIPVIACKLHRQLDQDSNFVVTYPSKMNSIEKKKPILHKNEQGHIIASLLVDNEDVDSAGNFLFYVKFMCLNSCHKDYGKKMKLICKLIELKSDEVLDENHFEIRICKNIKRDFKEAINEESSQSLSSVEKQLVKASKLQESIQAFHSSASTCETNSINDFYTDFTQCSKNIDAFDPADAATSKTKKAKFFKLKTSKGYVILQGFPLYENQEEKSQDGIDLNSSTEIPSSSQQNDLPSSDDLNQFEGFPLYGHPKENSQACIAFNTSTETPGSSQQNDLPSSNLKQFQTISIKSLRNTNSYSLNKEGINLDSTQTKPFLHGVQESSCKVLKGDSKKLPHGLNNEMNILHSLLAPNSDTDYTPSVSKLSPDKNIYIIDKEGMSSGQESSSKDSRKVKIDISDESKILDLTTPFSDTASFSRSSFEDLPSSSNESKIESIFKTKRFTLSCLSEEQKKIRARALCNSRCHRYNRRKKNRQRMLAVEYVGVKKKNEQLQEKLRKLVSMKKKLLEKFGHQNDSRDTSSIENHGGNSSLDK